MKYKACAKIGPPYARLLSIRQEATCSTTKLWLSSFADLVSGSRFGNEARAVPEPWKGRGLMLRLCTVLDEDR